MERDWKTIESGMLRLVKILPTTVGALAVNFYKDSFRKQGFTDQTLDKWPARKASKDKAARAEKRAILVKSGRLRRSIRVTQKTAEYVRIGSDVPYAKVHNEGDTINATAQVKSYRRRRFDREEVSAASAKKERWVKKQTGAVTVKAHSRQVKTTMPKRQFMGQSKALERLIRNDLKAKIKVLLK